MVPTTCWLDRVRPGCPDQLFTDLATLTGLDHRSSALEIDCETGQTPHPLGTIHTTTFEDRDPRDQRYDVVVTAP